MQLEDHIGDILRKALIFFEREQASLVTLSGLTPEQWQQLSEHGFIQDIPPQSLPWEKIGKFFRLDPQRLQAIAEGWLPPKLEPIPLGPVSGFHHIQTAGSTSFESDSLLNTVNSYLLANSSDRQAILFDPGWNATPTLEIIRRENLNLTHIFITHQHTDHIYALPDFLKNFSQAVLINFDYYKSAPLKPITLFQDRLTVTPLLTPGHSRDHLCFRLCGILPKQELMIIGDCLFSGSIGNPFYDKEKEKTSLMDIIFVGSSNTILCPGHGPLTTLKAELDHNPILSHPEWQQRIRNNNSLSNEYHSI